jgi:hypothetical protein
VFKQHTGRQKIRERMLADVPYYNYKYPNILNQVFSKAQIRLCEAYRADYILATAVKISKSFIYWE